MAQSEDVMHLAWPPRFSRRPISREAALDKVIAAERSIAYVRLGIVAFGVFLLLAVTPAIDPLVAWVVLASAGVYSLWILAAQPYRRHRFLLSGRFTTVADSVLILAWLYSTGGLASSTYVLIYAAIISVAYRYGQQETALATLLYSAGYLALGAVMGQTAAYTPDLIVRIAYFVFVGALSARFSGEALDQFQARLELRDLAKDLERESAERQRAEAALARHAEQLESRIAERTQALSAAKEQVETILNSTSDGIAFVRADGLVEHVNPAFCRLFGVRDGDVLGRRLADLVSVGDGEKLAAAFELAASAAGNAMVDVTCQNADGAVWHAEVAVTRAIAGADTAGIICSLRDVTERRRAEERLRAAVERERELNELKTRFVSMVSHEYRTPLASMLIAIDLLDRHYARLEEATRKEIAQRIRLHIKTMNSMLDDVLAIGRAESTRAVAQFASVDLAQLCEEVVTEQRAIAAQHHFSLEVEGERRPVAVDAPLIRRALTNLTTNAVKYSPAGSAVEICLAFGPDHVAFSVRDHGIGIPTEDQPRVFEAFHRSGNVGARPGTGLGLAIVRQAVDLHGGSVTLDSRVGNGTTITVSLPLEQPAE